MRKKYIYIILTVILLTEFSLIYDLNQIKPANASVLSECKYTPFINVSGEFKNPDSTAIKYSFPLIIKDVYIKENMFVNKGQALFSIDKEKMMDFVHGNVGEIDLYSMDISNLLSVSPSLLDNSELIKIPDTFYASESGVISNLNIKANEIFQEITKNKNNYKELKRLQQKAINELDIKL